MKIIQNMKNIANNYQLDPVTIESYNVRNNINNHNYLEITVGYERFALQTYPLVSLNPVQLEEATQDFLKFLGIDDIKNTKKKKFFSINNNISIFAFINIEMNQVFSLSAKYQTEDYEDSMNDFIKIEGNEYLKYCNKEEAIIMASLQNSPKLYQNEDIKKLVDTHKLKCILEKELIIKESKNKNKI